MIVEEIDIEEWRDALPTSGVEVFHHPDALPVIADHSSTELRLFGAYKGQQPVGLVPLFVKDSSIGRAVFSPPASLGIPRLGPILDPNSPKRRKRERINAELAEGVIDALELANRRTLFRMICPVEYADPRPYEWNGFSVEPQFTYTVDLEDADTNLQDVLSRFSSSLRREARVGRDLDIEIRWEGIDGARAVHEDTASRYREQGAGFSIPWEYVRDLLEALDDRARVYVARAPDGRFLSGIVTLFSDDVGYFWMGGTRATYENVSVNSVLHCTIVEDILTDPQLDSITRYDLVGANTERLCEYKGKFNGTLRPYYVVESAGLEMSVAKSAYSTVSNVVDRR